ncbi:MAG: metallophosphoesterase [Ruminiclostridium sp.]
MSLYAIGDLHLSFGTDKPMDIFKGWDNHVEKLERNWNETVSDQDTVVVVGDVSWAMKLEHAYKDFEFINNRLKGKKIFLKGNHDYWWSTAAKMNNFLEESGFDKISILSNNSYLVSGVSVCGTRGWINDTTEAADVKLLNREASRLDLSIQEGIKLGGELIAFIHYPPVFSNEKNYYILEVLQKYGIQQCFYGHIHGRAGFELARQGLIDGIEYTLISADYVDFTPKLIKK